MVEYCHQFLRGIEAIKPYLVKFEEDDSIKSKIYPKDYAISGFNCYSIIFIIYDKNTFNANNGY